MFFYYDTNFRLRLRGLPRFETLFVVGSVELACSSLVHFFKWFGMIIPSFLLS